jgi:N6-adenosine-specific RNA methylase IME4
VTWSERNQYKAPARHYDVMTPGALAALPIADLAADDCFLVMWATQAMLLDALDLMASWGFKYKTMGCWAKRSKADKSWAFGTGYILRSASEPYLIGTRGKPKPAVRNVRNLIVAPIREHSRKPDQMHADLERMFPHARRLELFGRASRPGWLVLGNEATKFDLARATR